MRIAFFVWEFYPKLVGGLGTYAIEITRKFIELGIDVTVFTLNPGDLQTHELWKGVFVHRPKIIDLSNVFPLIVTDDLRRWGTNLKMFCDIFSYNHLAASKFINELIMKENEHYDIVAVHDWMSAIAGLVIKKEIPALPVAFHVHSTEQQRSGGVGSEVIKHFERSIAESADKIVTVSFAMRDHLNSIGFPNDKIRVSWNGCDPRKYNPETVKPSAIEEIKRKYNISSKEKVVFFIGRLVWIKGVQNLVQAMPSVLRDFPETKLVILGKGGSYDDLVQLARRLSVEKQIRFRSDFIPEDERILHYAMADVCVFPSISEPFGIVSLEAMSMEKPVIVGARGLSGFREQVTSSGQEQCGIHINGEDFNDVAWGIKEVLKDPDRARTWGKNGRKRVLHYFTWDNVVQNTLEIYEEALGKSI
ncbi:MAG: glycogen synthase [Thermoproteota archaeon]|nr:glycogen synthase [Thermoproteota archaeon]